MDEGWHEGRPVAEPARQLPSEFGIRNGRISKLWIAEVHGEGKYKCVCSYDRGWDRRATTTVARAIRDEAIKMYN